MEREKIINSLRCHVGCDRGFNCSDCAYIGNGDCLELLTEDVFDLLKKQPEIVRCKDCRKNMMCQMTIGKPKDWFCADGQEVKWK